MNSMRGIRVEKIVLNIGCGTKGKLEHAKIILDKISGMNSVMTKTKKRSTFGVPKNKHIGFKVTIRENADELLKKLLEAKEKLLSEGNFDDTGNVCFGVKEYIDVPGQEYDPHIGIMGFDVCVSLERRGYRVKRKKIASRIGKKHKITKEDAIEFMKKEFDIRVE